MAGPEAPPTLQLRGHLIQRLCILLFRSKLRQLRGVTQIFSEGCQDTDNGFQLRTFLVQRLGPVLVIPDVRVRQLPIDLF